jgi:hypothetical protein
VAEADHDVHAGDGVGRLSDAVDGGRDVARIARHHELEVVVRARAEGEDSRLGDGHGPVLIPIGPKNLQETCITFAA